MHVVHVLLMRRSRECKKLIGKTKKGGEMCRIGMEKDMKKIGKPREWERAKEEESE